MKYYGCLLGTLFLFGTSATAPSEAGIPGGPVPIFEQRARHEPILTASDVPEGEFQEGKDEFCKDGGWHCIVPEAAARPPWRSAPAVLHNRLWAISKEGIVAQSEDARSWCEPETTPPFASTGFQNSPEFQMFAFSGQMWVMTYHQSREASGLPAWNTTGLWSSQDGDAWEDLSMYLPELVGRARPALLGGSMVLVDTSSAWTSPDGMNWTPATKRAPWGPRVEFSVTAHDNALFLLGGRTVSGAEPADGSLCTDVWRSVDAIRWECVNTAVPFPHRTRAALTSYREYLWLIGGAVGSTSSNDTWVSRDGQSWQCLMPSAPWRPRFGAEAVEFNNFLWLVGGRSEYGYLEDALWSTSDGKDWQGEAQGLPWKPRVNATVLRFKDAWWMLGGYEVDFWYFGSNPKPDIWRTTDWKSWEQVGTLPTSIERKRIKILAGTDTLWIITLADNSEDPYRLEVWRSDDGTNWSSVKTKPDWVYWQICAAEVLNDNLVVFTEPRREHGFRSKSPPWNVVTSRNGERWETIGSIPSPAEDGNYSLRTFSQDGSLWAYPIGRPSRDMWRSDDAKQWIPVPMTTFPVACYSRKFLWCDGYLWLTNAKWAEGEASTYSEVNFELRDWWRSRDGNTWERVPFATRPRSNSTIEGYSQALVDTTDGLILVDTVACSVYRWDPELAERCYIPEADDADIGIWTSSGHY